MTIVINGSGTITGLSAGGLPDASVSASDLASGAAVSNIGAGGITSNELATAVRPLGVGQTWTNVAASRAYGTTYTNTTGRPIMVYTLSYGVSSSSYITVNGVTAGGANTTGTASNVWGVVPAGATYSVSCTTSNVIWTELR